MIKIVLISTFIIFFVFLGFTLYFKRYSNDSLFIINYVTKRKEKKDVSIIIERNDSQIISINPNIVLPLASTVKIVIAIEYARQVSNKIIDENTLVPKEELLKYFIEKTDGGAHKRWVQHFNDKDFYSLKEITIGMIAFSSNANTEFLMDYLGLEAINNVLLNLRLNNHSTIFPIVSSLYIPSYIGFKEQIIKKEELLKRLSSMSMDEYSKYSIIIHDHLKKNKYYEYMENIKLDYEFQKIWSDRLPASSTIDYLKVMKMINIGKQFGQNMQKCIEEIMSYSLFTNEKNREWIERGGFKGGSTLFVYTYASFTTDKKGNQTEIVFMANNLNPITSKRIQLNFNQFVLNTLTDESFRSKLSNA